MIQHGNAPFLECSSRGDKRFSALFARIKARGNRTIEEMYQAAKVFEDGSTGLTFREAKGRKPANLGDVRALYRQLWEEYMTENPQLLPVICAASGLSDVFGRPGSVCQATELWRIRNDVMVRHMTPAVEAVEADGAEHQDEVVALRGA